MIGLLGAQPAAACSRRSPLLSPVADPQVTRFVGRATVDTVRAGAGTVRFVLEAGHFGRPARDRPIYGQVIGIARLAPTTPPALREAVRRAGGRVVLVPWDYAADCQPVPWGRSARWVEHTSPGLFEGRLREMAHWVGGVPTLDVGAPEFWPYTGLEPPFSRGGLLPADRRRLDPPEYTGALLTPDQLLELQSRLPTRAEVEAHPETAFDLLRAWAKAHPTLATREPAPSLLAAAEGAIQGLRFQRRAVPLAGTYRVTVWMADSTRSRPGALVGDSSQFFVRTEARPSSPLGMDGPPIGMYVSACAYSREADLPPDASPNGCHSSPAVGAEGYVAFGDSAWTDGDGRRVSAGSVDVAVGDSAFRARYDQLLDARLSALRPDPPPSAFLPGRFTVTADGRVTFAWTYGPSAAPLLRVTAERVSEGAFRGRGPR